MWHAGRLTGEQARVVEALLGPTTLVEDLSWDVVDTAVLHLRAARGDVVVKAAGEANHHIGREITAHERHTAPLVERTAAPRLVGASREANLLVTEYLPGRLVEGAPAEYERDTYVEAGRLLRLFHDQDARSDPDAERTATERALAWLDAEHRIAQAAERAARAVLRAYRPPPLSVVPTHGDWQPRNWLVDDGRIIVIDFGRFAFRPAASDLCRLAAQQWRTDPALELAFLEGYGSDPRDPSVWPVMQLREAIGTAAWAYQVGNATFEAQGHRMLAEALDAVGGTAPPR